MASKLTSKKLKELIKEVLKEEKQQLDEKISISIDPTVSRDTGYADLKNKAGLTTKYGKSYQQTGKDGMKLVNLDKTPLNKLEDDDFEQAFKKKSGVEFDVADWLKDNSNIPRVKKAAQDAYNKVKGSSPTGKYGPLLSKYGLTTSSNKTDVKTEIFTLASLGSGANAAQIKDANDLNDYLFSMYSKTPSAGSHYMKCKKAIAKMTTSPPGSEQFNLALKTLTSSLNAMDAGDVPFTRPTVYTTPSEEGKYPAELISSFDTVLKGAQTIEKRVERISLVSKAMVSGDPLTFMEKLGMTNAQDQKRFLLSMLMVVDYIAAFAKYFDHGGGAYLFEAFCSLITGGGVIGKGMGSGDFTITAASGEEYKGSSKFYQDGTTMNQAGSGFKKGEPVTYIVAQKRGLSVGAGGKLGDKVGPTSDVRGLTEIGIFIGDITVTDYTKVGRKGAVENITLDTSNAGDLDFSVADSTDRSITIKALGTPTHTVYLADATKAKGNFKKSIEDVMNKQEPALQQAFEKFKDFIEASMKVDALTKKYIDTGDRNDGDDALKATAALDKEQVDLINDIKGAGQATVGKIGSGERTLEENKKNKTKSIKDLDKLIERVIIESMNKK